MKDTYRHKGLRKKLIVTLRQKGVTDERVLEAIALIPRHLFLEKAFEEWAYTDKAFPIGNIAFNSGIVSVWENRPAKKIKKICNLPTLVE